MLSKLKLLIRFILFTIIDVFVKQKYRIKLKTLLLIRLDAIGDYVLFRNYIKILKDEYKEYKQRLLALVESVKTNKYPYEDKYIILFNDQKIIRDGQYRAAVLAHLHGLDSDIKVMRFNFDTTKHLMNINKSNFRTAFIWFARKVYRKLRRYIKR